MPSSRLDASTPSRAPYAHALRPRTHTWDIAPVSLPQLGVLQNSAGAWARQDEWFPPLIAGSWVACITWTWLNVGLAVEIGSVIFSVYFGRALPFAAWRYIVPRFEATFLLAAIVLHVTIGGSAACSTATIYVYPIPRLTLLPGTCFLLLRLALTGLITTAENEQRLIGYMRLSLPLGNVDERSLAALAGYRSHRAEVVSTRERVPARADTASGPSEDGSLVWSGSSRAPVRVQGTVCEPVPGVRVHGGLCVL